MGAFISLPHTTAAGESVCRVLEIADTNLMKLIRSIWGWMHCDGACFGHQTFVYNTHILIRKKLWEIRNYFPLPTFQRLSTLTTEPSSSNINSAMNVLAVWGDNNCRCSRYHYLQNHCQSKFILTIARHKCCTRWSVTPNETASKLCVTSASSGLIAIAAATSLLVGQNVGL